MFALFDHPGVSTTLCLLTTSLQYPVFAKTVRILVTFTFLIFIIIILEDKSRLRSCPSKTSIVMEQTVRTDGLHGLLNNTMVEILSPF